MIYNRKVRFTEAELKELHDKFYNEKAVYPTHCYYNPTMLDIDYLYRESMNLSRFNTDVHCELVGRSEFRLWGMHFIEDKELDSQLKFITVKIIE